MKKIAVLGLVLFSFSCGLLLADEAIGKFLDSESNVREAASTKSKILFVPKAGEEFRVISRDGQKWLKVQLKDGREGWTNIINVNLYESLPPDTKSGIELSDFYGTWTGSDIVDVSEEMFVDTLSEEKFLIFSGLTPYKLAIKKTILDKKANSLVLMLEGVDEETQEVYQTQWNFQLKKGTKKELEVSSSGYFGNFYFSSDKMSPDLETAYKELSNPNNQKKDNENSVSANQYVVEDDIKHDDSMNDELAREKEAFEFERKKLEIAKEQLRQEEQQLHSAKADLERYAERQLGKLDKRIEKFKNDQEKLAIVKKLLSEGSTIAYSDVKKACKVLSSNEVNEILVDCQVSWEGWVYTYYGGTIRQRKCEVDVENRSPTTGHVVFAIQDKDVEHGWILKEGAVAVGNHIRFTGKIESISVGLLGGVTVSLQEVTQLAKKN
ncbi:hypothetical protein EOM81_10080 [bacterium]|nr:hypothetical protein [bacterium]